MTATKMTVRLRHFFSTALWEINTAECSRVKRYSLKSLQFLLLVVRNFWRDQCLLQASALAFTSILPLVPFLAILFAILAGFGLQHQLEPLVLEQLSAGSQEVASRIIRYIDNTSMKSLGLYGLLTLFVTVFMLLDNVENSFNAIWGVTETRKLRSKLGGYIGVIISTPLLVFSTISVTTFIENQDIFQWLLNTAHVGELFLQMLRFFPYLVTVNSIPPLDPVCMPLKPLYVNLDIEMPCIGKENAVPHHRDMMAGNHGRVPRGGDEYLANGLSGSDGMPDVLNESRWGLDWLIKMNPEPERMYNQIADDRDHVGFRFPNHDSANYGKGHERPVYLCTGKPQGLFKYKNRATGIASTAGKFSSAFALGAEVYRSINPEFSQQLKNKAVAAFEYGLKNPGVCQTAPGTAPYFYEEDNWVDDMELAAIELYNLTRESKYFDYATEFGRQEITTPWMGKDTANHYQWYPFVNMGHANLAMANSETGNTGNAWQYPFPSMVLPVQLIPSILPVSGNLHYW